jgi:hypothetical protein
MNLPNYDSLLSPQDPKEKFLTTADKA